MRAIRKVLQLIGFVVCLAAVATGGGIVGSIVTVQAVFQVMSQ